MDLGIADATAVVTGGSKGMGRAVAEVLAADGARVAVMARGRGALDETVDALSAAGSPDAVGISVDMADPASIAAAFSEVGARWDSLNILVHTIGPGAGRFEQLDDGGWDEAFALGTMSAVRSVRAALPLLRGAEWGRVAIFSAHSIQRQSPNLVAYTASKAAVTSLAKNLAKSLAPEGILVNVVCPGTIVTASFTENLKEIFADEGLDASNPHDVMRWIEHNFHHPVDLGRAGLPDEVASLTAYLVSRRNGYVTGACVNADGGSDFL
jgi:3-oxoacyl-[acyl-carrier protein] reductase